MLHLRPHSSWLACVSAEVCWREAKKKEKGSTSSDLCFHQRERRGKEVGGRRGWSKKKQCDHNVCFYVYVNHRSTLEGEKKGNQKLKLTHLNDYSSWQSHRKGSFSSCFWSFQLYHMTFLRRWGCNGIVDSNFHFSENIKEFAPMLALRLRLKVNYWQWKH